MSATYTSFATFEEASLAAAGWTVNTTGLGVAERYTTAPLVGTASLRVANPDTTEKQATASHAFTPGLAAGESCYVGFRLKVLGTVSNFVVIHDGGSGGTCAFCRGDALYGYNDDGSFTTAAHGISFAAGSSHFIEIEVKRASANGVNDGYVKLWDNGVLRATITRTNYNRAATISALRLGWGGTVPPGVNYLIDSVYAAKLSPFDARDLWAVDAGRTGKTSSLLTLINSQCDGLTTKTLWMSGYQAATDGVLVDQGRVGHGELKNGAAFTGAQWSHTFRGLPNGAILMLNGFTHRVEIGTLTGCLPEINTSGISGSFVCKPSNISGTRTIVGVDSNGQQIIIGITDGSAYIYLYDGFNGVVISTDTPIIQAYDLTRVSFSLLPNLTGFIMVNGAIIPATILGTWPDLFNDPVSSIAIGAVGAISPYSHFAGEIALVDMRFGQGMSQADASAIHGMLMVESGGSAKVDPTVSRALIGV